MSQIWDTLSPAVAVETENAFVQNINDFGNATGSFRNDGFQIKRSKLMQSKTKFEEVYNNREVVINREETFTWLIPRMLVLNSTIKKCTDIVSEEGFSYPGSDIDTKAKLNHYSGSVTAGIDEIIKVLSFEEDTSPIHWKWSFGLSLFAIGFIGAVFIILGILIWLKFINLNYEVAPVFISMGATLGIAVIYELYPTNVAEFKRQYVFRRKGVDLTKS